MCTFARILQHTTGQKIVFQDLRYRNKHNETAKNSEKYYEPFE